MTQLTAQAKPEIQPVKLEDRFGPFSLELESCLGEIIEAFICKTCGAFVHINSCTTHHLWHTEQIL